MNLKTKTNQAKHRMSLSRTDCKRFRTAAALLFFLFVPALLFALDYTEHPLDYYKENHSADYDFALATSRKIYGELKNQNYEYALEAAAIVFPEIVRYSSFQDEIESLFNELLTVCSEESNGFSIGPMQMKPLFACEVERLVSATPKLRRTYSAIDFGGDSSTVDARRERILRLRQLSYQIEYLKAFVAYETEALGLQNASRNDKIKYLSAAYNMGIHTERSVLEAAFNQAMFPSGKRRLYFNYQKICIDAAEKISASAPN